MTPHPGRTGPARPEDTVTADPASPLVVRTTAGGVVTLALSRPDKFNALSGAMLDALAGGLDAVATDPAVRVVVLAGAGRAFCAGHDLRELLDHPDAGYVGDLFRRCSELMLAIRRMPQPVIAKVQGIATAAGCQLVAACDLAVAAEEARFATSGINLGLFCATPGVALSRTVATKRAFEMLFTGGFIDAATALDWGLVNRVVPAAALDEEVQHLAANLAAKPPGAIAAGKALFYAQLEQPLTEAYRLAADCITRNMLGAEAREGVGAFLEKRAPRWPA